MSYTRYSRLRHAYKFIRYAARNGFLERTKSHHVSNTYGLNDPDLVKRIKAKFRCELSFSGEGK